MRSGPLRLIRTIVLVTLAAAVTAGCGSDGTTTPTARESSSTSTTPGAPTGTAAAAASGTYPAWSATARGADVMIRSAPDGPVSATLASSRPSGAPLTFLVVQRRGKWVKVLLPVPPNGSSGWVRADQVRLAGLRYRLDVRRGAHRLDLYDRGRLLRTYPIGVGSRATPTPGGTFYLTELLAVPNPKGPYGPFAYGLSGRSTTLRTFKGADAVVGLHGTDDPASVGRDVSHGCIRLRNADITALARLLPLGTPVHVLA